MTFAEADRILGMSSKGAVDRVEDGRIKPVGGPRTHGRLSRDAVEAIALAEYRPSMISGEESYWIDGKTVAELLGVVHQFVSTLAGRGHLPFETTTGKRLYRRAQIEVVANARALRRMDRASAEQRVVEGQGSADASSAA